MLGQQGHRPLVQDDATVTAGLGVLLPNLAAILRDGLLQMQHATVQIEMSPPNRTDLATTRAHDHREPDERPPVGSLRQARFRRAAASSALGGCGLDAPGDGALAPSIGLIVIQPHRIALENAPVRI